MAVARFKNLQSLLENISPCHVRWMNGCKYYSQYAPKYVEPITDLKQLDKELKMKSKEEIEFLSVKAAKTQDTTSVFKDDLITYCINILFRWGRKEKARDLVHKALLHIKHNQLRAYNAEKDEEKKKEIIIRPKEVFRLAVENTMPVLQVTKVKKSGTWYQVPKPIETKRAMFEAIRWILEEAYNREKTIPYPWSLANEILAASKKEGKAYNRKIGLHKLCETNRGYAHYKFT